MTNNISNKSITLKELTTQISIIIIFVLIFTILLLIFRPEFKGTINWKPLNEADLGSQIAVLIFISLAIESSIEIFLSNFRETRKIELEEKIKSLESKSEKNEDEKKELEIKKKQLRQYSNKTKKVTNFAGLFFGFGVALSGFRVLQPFVEDLNLVKWQSILFHTIDILLAAGLLSGGSSGIHRITRIYNEFTDQAREKIKGSAQ